MPTSVGTASSNFPQSGSNRTVGQHIAEICDYTGGRSRKEYKNRARSSLRSAVQEFNSICWGFNLLVDDIDLSSAASGTGISAGQEYDLEADFKAPKRAFLLDSAGLSRDDVLWVNFGEWRTFYTDHLSTASSPLYYTARNHHEVGRIMTSPRLDTSNLTWPTLRVVYFRWIVWPTTDSTKLNVPQDVDEAILQLAIGKFISKVRSFGEARDAFTLAKVQRNAVELVHQDHPDPRSL